MFANTSLINSKYSKIGIGIGIGNLPIRNSQEFRIGNSSRKDTDGPIGNGNSYEFKIIKIGNGIGSFLANEFCKNKLSVGNY